MRTFLALTSHQDRKMGFIIFHILGKVTEEKNNMKTWYCRKDNINNEVIFEIEKMYYPHSFSKLSVYTKYCLLSASKLFKLQFSKSSFNCFLLVRKSHFVMSLSQNNSIYYNFISFSFRIVCNVVNFLSEYTCSLSLYKIYRY